MKTHSKFRGARIISVLEVVVLEGHGEVEDPYREVTYYLHPDSGTVLATRDLYAKDKHLLEPKLPNLEPLDRKWN